MTASASVSALAVVLKKPDLIRVFSMNSKAPGQLWLGVFVSVLYLALAPPVHALCPPPQNLQAARLDSVVDGDTLRLADGRLASSDSGGAELSPAVWAPPDSSFKSSLAAILGFSIDFSWPSARLGSGIAETVGLWRSWGPSPRPPSIGGAAAPSPILGLDEPPICTARKPGWRIAHSSIRRKRLLLLLPRHSCCE